MLYCESVISKKQNMNLFVEYPKCTTCQKAKCTNFVASLYRPSAVDCRTHPACVHDELFSDRTLSQRHPAARASRPCHASPRPAPRRRIPCAGAQRHGSGKQRDSYGLHQVAHRLNPPSATSLYCKSQTRTKRRLRQGCRIGCPSGHPTRLPANQGTPHRRHLRQ